MNPMKPEKDFKFLEDDDKTYEEKLDFIKLVMDREKKKLEDAKNEQKEN
jgi:hypothetical protein